MHPLSYLLPRNYPYCYMLYYIALIPLELKARGGAGFIGSAVVFGSVYGSTGSDWMVFHQY